MDFTMYLNEDVGEYTIPQEEFEALDQEVAFLRRSFQDKILEREENIKLKEEIEQEVDTSLGACEKIVEMRQFCMNIHNILYGTKYNDEDIVSSFDFPEMLKRMAVDQEEIIHPDDIAKLFGQKTFEFFSWNEAITLTLGDVAKLKKEIKELKETILARDEELGDIKENVFPGYDDDIENLKETIKELKEAVDCIIMGDCMLIQEGKRSILYQESE